MSQSFDDSDEKHSLSENNLSNRVEGEQIVAGTRESFFVVRKPTKMRLAVSKIPIPAKIHTNRDLIASRRHESSILAGTSLTNRRGPLTHKNLDTHEDELSVKSSLSVSTPAEAMSDRIDTLKDRSIASSKNSRFRISRIPFLEKMELNGSFRTPKNEDFDDIMSFGTKEKLAPQKTYSNPGLYRSLETKFLRAINDKSEYSQVDSITQNEGLDKKLRNVLKKHALKKKETYDMLEILRKLKLNQSRSVVFKLGVRLKNKTKKHYSTFKHGLKYFLKPIDPQGIFTSIWHSFLMFFIFYELMAVPFELAFDNDFDSVFTNIEWVETIFFFIDMMLGFCTSWYQDGVLVNDRRLIAWYYLKSWFVVDFLCCFPFQLLFSYHIIGVDRYFITLLGLLRALKIIRIAKVFKIKGAFSKVQDFVRLSGELNGIMRLVKLCFTIIFVAHWCACFWHLIGSHPGDYEQNWIDAYGLQDAKTNQRYVKSLYWSIATLLTVGYGDIVATNMAEQVYSIFVMLLGSGIIGFSMNSIGEILQQINSEVNYKEKKLQELRKFMDRNEIDSKLQVKAKQYIEFKLEHERAMKESDRTILQSLSHSLRDQMLKQVNGRVMKNNELFQKAFGSNLVIKLSMMLDEQLLAPDEYIFKEHEYDDLSLYFVARGRVETFFEKFKVSLHPVEKGSYVGEFSFFTQKPREVSAKTMTFTSIFCLSHEKFMEILESFPTDKEMYHMLKDKINLSENYSSIGLKCGLCRGEDHMANECPKTHLITNKPKVIRRYIESKELFAKNFQRKSRQKFHSLQDLRNVERAVRRVQTMEAVKNQMTTSLTEQEITMSGENKNKKLTFLHINSDEDSQTNEIAAEALYKTLARVKDEETGVTKLMKKKRSLESEDTEVMSRFRKSFTMKHTGEAVFIPFKIQIADEKIQKQREEEEIVFDEMRNYEIYFPHNNLRKVIEQYGNKRAKKKTLKTNLASEQDIISFKMKLGKIFEKGRKKNGSEVSSREVSPVSVRRKSMFFKRNLAPGLMKLKSKSLTKVGDEIETVEFDRKKVIFKSKSREALLID